MKTKAMKQTEALARRRAELAALKSGVWDQRMRDLGYDWVTVLTPRKIERAEQDIANLERNVGR